MERLPGNNLSLTGAELIAGKDIRLSGENVSIRAAQNQSRSEQTHQSQKSGLTLALSGPVGSAINVSAP